jgi:hypothetical protein
MQKLSIEPTLQRIEVKLDRLDNKLDNLLERVVRTETVTNNNKATIKVMLVSLLGAISATAVYIVRYIIKL